MKVFKGKVVSTKMEKTATVEVERVVSHPVYKKRYKRTKKYHVHAPVEVSVGQAVKFVACKPYSKMKKWILVEVEGKKVNSAKDKAQSKESIKGIKSTEGIKSIKSDGGKLKADSKMKKGSK